MESARELSRVKLSRLLERVRSRCPARSPLDKRPSLEDRFTELRLEFTTRGEERGRGDWPLIGGENTGEFRVEIYNSGYILIF